MTGPEERADGVDPPPRDVVWSAGQEPRRTGRWPALRRWLVLAVLAGAASFVLAYALHLATAAPVAPTSGAPVWVPEGRAACPSSGHRDG